MITIYDDVKRIPSRQSTYLFIVEGICLFSSIFKKESLTLSRSVAPGFLESPDKSRPKSNSRLRSLQPRNTTDRLPPDPLKPSHLFYLNAYVMVLLTENMLA